MPNRRIVIGETCIDASAEPYYLDLIPQIVLKARSAIKSRISSDPDFGSSFGPISPSDGDHPVVYKMCQASVSADVGPMAAVAGAIAEFVTERLSESGCKQCIIDNGGDIAYISSEEIEIGLFTGNPQTAMRLCLPPSGDGIMGVCSSSGTVGHSFSYGVSDIVTVVSEDVALADACATSLGNGIKCASDLKRETERICGIPGVIGCVASIGDSIAVCGDIRNPSPVYR